MCACEFTDYQPVIEVQAAFELAVERAQQKYGCDGDTGTIAEKSYYSVLRMTPVSMEEAHALADRFLDDRTNSVTDKDGPAGAIPVADSTTGQPIGWLFFGFAAV